MRRTIKGLPIAAVLFVAVVFGGKAMMKEAKVAAQTTKHWVYNPSLAPGCTPLMEECYELYEGDGGLGALCQNEDEVCGIVAPRQDENDGDPNKPEIDFTLETDIESGAPVPNRVFWGPKAN